MIIIKNAAYVNCFLIPFSTNLPGKLIFELFLGPAHLERIIRRGRLKISVEKIKTFPKEGSCSFYVTGLLAFFQVTFQLAFDPLQCVVNGLHVTA